MSYFTFLATSLDTGQVPLRPLKKLRGKHPYCGTLFKKFNELQLALSLYNAIMFSVFTYPLNECAFKYYGRIGIISRFFCFNLGNAVLQDEAGSSSLNG